MLVTNQTTQDYWFGPLHLAGGVGQTLTVDDTTATSLYLTDDTVADAINNLYNSAKIAVTSAAAPFPRPTGTPELLHGDGSPEGLTYAPQGSLYMRRDGTGTNSLYVKTTGVTINTGWESFGSAVGGAGTEWDYAQITSSPTAVSATTEATSVAQITGNPVTYDGTRVKVEFWCPKTVFGSGSGPEFIGVFYRDTTVIGHFTMNQGAPQNSQWFGSVKAETYDTPSAASHTYSIKAYISASGSSQVIAGAGGPGNYEPAFLRVTKA
jgi:hypothetical protein